MDIRICIAIILVGLSNGGKAKTSSPISFIGHIPMKAREAYELAEAADLAIHTLWYRNHLRMRSAITRIEVSRRWLSRYEAEGKTLFAAYARKDIAFDQLELLRLKYRTETLWIAKTASEKEASRTRAAMYGLVRDEIPADALYWSSAKDMTQLMEKVSELLA